MRNLEDDTGFLILQVSNSWKNYHEEILKKHHHISYIQYVVLADIYWFTLRNKKQVTQAMLAKHTKIDPMTISYIFKGLEAKGYICRVTHPTDVRAKAVNLTQEGKDLLCQIVKTVAEADMKFFTALGKSAERFNRDLMKLLQGNN